MGWAEFWAIFSQTHLVTLDPWQTLRKDYFHETFKMRSDGSNLVSDDTKINLSVDKN
jgi:hypothetical protein